MVANLTLLIASISLFLPTLPKWTDHWPLFKNTSYNITSSSARFELLNHLVLMPVPEREILDSLAVTFLETDSIFVKDWETDLLFPNRKTVAEMPDSMLIVLRVDGESFKYSNYGALNWGYGQRFGRSHQGIDTQLSTGDSVFSAFNGIVRYAQYNRGGYGNAVIVRHFNGLETLYAHLSRIDVEPNQLVLAGEVLGAGGSTGRSSGPHLHFETRLHGLSFNPLLMIDPKTFELAKDSLWIKRIDFVPNVSALRGQDIINGKEPVVVNNYTSGKSGNTASSYKTVKVRNGDTLSTIAERYGTTVSRIKKLNNMSSTRIYAGKSIKVPR